MSIEDIEMDRHRKSLDKYIRIMDWDIPEVDGPKARRLVLDEIRQAITRLDGGSS